MITTEQEAAIRRCEAAQRSGYTARKVRMMDLDSNIQAAIADKYHTDEVA